MISLAQTLCLVTPASRQTATAWLMRWRRNAGIVYGSIQTVHLVIVCAMFLLLPEPPTETIMVIVGAVGLALSLAMLLASFLGPTRAIGARLWKLTHKAGFYVFMFIYFFDFVVEPARWGIRPLTFSGQH